LHTSWNIVQADSTTALVLHLGVANGQRRIVQVASPGTFLVVEIRVTLFDFQFLAVIRRAMQFQSFLGVGLFVSIYRR
jgi:hypothetical protein